MDHDANVIGAAVLMLSDRMQAEIEEASGLSGARPAALVALHGWAEGETIETLSQGLGLSHSRTVRVVDALASDGLVVRIGDANDKRLRLVKLTASGRSLAKVVLDARAAGIESCLGALPAGRQAAFAQAAEVLLASAAPARPEARTLCRLCDLDACGFSSGDCPATAVDVDEEQAPGKPS